LKNIMVQTFRYYPCLGAIIGDTVGSVFEFDNIKQTDFPLFSLESNYTDDSIMTIAVGDWLANTDRSQSALEEKLVSWAKQYPCPMGGYGGAFSRWLFAPQLLANYEEEGMSYQKSLVRHPYNSWGNGSAMRASACGWVAYTIDQALDLGKRSAEITHNHPEGIKGAQAVAVAIYLAHKREKKEYIRDCIEDLFKYDLRHTCDEIRPDYRWEASCQGTVPPALIAFFDSHDFESAIRLAVSLGGDSDTLACITGGIAHAYYEAIPEWIISEMRARLPQAFWNIIDNVERLVFK
jgi:ADP-ribosylglycohydrolase